MTTGVAMNLEGVRPEALETAREAARRSGLSLGQWLNSAIIGTAADAGHPAARRPAYAPSTAPEDDSFALFNDRLDDLAQRLDMLARTRSDVALPRAVSAAAAPAAPAPARRAPSQFAETRPQQTPQRLSDAITRLNSRLDQMVEVGPGPQGLDHRVAAIDRAIAELNREAPAVDTLSEMENAVAEITARQRVLDGEPGRFGARPRTESPPTAPDLSGLERQLKTITAQLETLHRPCGAQEMVAVLRQDLAEVIHTLNEALPRRALESLQAEVRALAERVEAGARHGVDQTAMSGIERGLVEIHNSLNALAPAEAVAGFDHDLKVLSHKIDALAATNVDPEALHQVQGAILELQGLAGRVASDETVRALSEDMHVIAAKLDRLALSGDPGPGSAAGFETLAERIEMLGAAIDARNYNPPAPPVDFEALIHVIAEKLEQVRPSQEDRLAFEHLEQQIIGLAQKLEVSDARLGSIAGVEHVIAELAGELKAAHDSAMHVAEQVARAAAREAVGEAGPGLEVHSLKHELSELRDNQVETDRRTQDTLEAVHGTLERLVDRLAMIETDMRAGAVPAPASVEPEPEAPRGAIMRGPAPTPPGPVPASAPLPNRPPPAGPIPPAMSKMAAPPGGERRPINPNLPADHPLEPGSAVPQGRVVASPAERIAASEAALGAAKPAAPEAGGKANFIAAARRAAQAAASDAATGAHVDEDKAGHSVLAAITGKLGKFRRPLLLGIGAVLVLVGGLNLYFNVLGGGEHPRVEPARPAPGDSHVPGRDLPKAAVPAAPAAPAAPVAPAPAEPRPAAPAPAATPAPGRQSSLTPAAPANDVTGSFSPPSISSYLQQPSSSAPAARSATDIPAAIRSPLLRSAAAGGDPAAAYEIGLRFAEGRGVPQSLEEAVAWFDRAAKGGLAPAQYRLGSLYEKGQGVKRDLETARQLYMAAADKGNGKAMHNLAVVHAEGIDGTPDYKTAAQWFRKAADRGVPDSQYNLGILYARGIGVEQNLAESYKWFSLAAAQGDQDAAKKRDDVASRLDAQSLVAARLAVQSWTAEPQPETAVNVPVPEGGWDRADAAPAPAKGKSAPRKVRPS